MEPLDLRKRPPRGCREELDGLMLMPRTIDKLRAFLPGGNPGEYFINGPIPGMSGFLLGRLGIEEASLLEAVRASEDEAAIANWLRERTDPAQYPAINETLRRIQPKHAQDPEIFGQIYAETLRENPHLEYIVDIVDADDRRIFGA
jgi:hypothetical protein